MSYTALENSPIIVNLLVAANDTGWSVDGTVANHDSCNSGYIKLSTLSLISGDTYQVSYSVLSITGGYVQLFAGTTGGIQRTTAGNYVETITTNGTELSFFSNANCSVKAFNIRNTITDTSNSQKHTAAYSSTINKWTSFYTFAPDYGISLFTNTFTMNQGILYIHQHNSPNRCNFYGVQYVPTIDFATSQQPTIAKTFISVNYQANQLLIAPSGIATSTQQLSDLNAQDFVQASYNDGSQAFSVEWLYQASFLRDMNVDLINGPQLKGNWMDIQLQATSPSTPMDLFTVEVNYVHSYQNIR